MKKWLLAAVSAVAMLAMAAQAETLLEGKHYKIVNPAGKTAEPTVIEVFSYGCPVCFRVEPEMESWMKSKPANIKFIRLPHYAIHDEGQLFIKTFYTAEALGIVDKIHGPLFSFVHVDHKHFNSEDDAVKFLAQFGKDAKIVRETFNGFYVDMKVKEAQSIVKNMRISGTPAFIINNKYVTDGGMAGNMEVLKQALTELALKK